ncbi:MAG: hypothetical protein AAFR00_03885 [Pseudomonadota bacterium]
MTGPDLSLHQRNLARFSAWLAVLVALFAPVSGADRIPLTLRRTLRRELRHLEAVARRLALLLSETIRDLPTPAGASVPARGRDRRGPRPPSPSHDGRSLGVVEPIPGQGRTTAHSGAYDSIGPRIWSLGAAWHPLPSINARLTGKPGCIARRLAALQSFASDPAAAARRLARWRRRAEQKQHGRRFAVLSWLPRGPSRLPLLHEVSAYLHQACWALPIGPPAPG